MTEEEIQQRLIRMKLTPEQLILLTALLIEMNNETNRKTNHQTRV